MTWLGLNDTMVTHQGSNQLKQALPGLTIWGRFDEADQFAQSE
jgi:hypothetical protein